MMQVELDLETCSVFLTNYRNGYKPKRGAELSVPFLFMREHSDGIR